ncbi:hypothetical protein ACFP2T_25095 [Plantactinospora solaniradicis]|uniref:Uncharacterized protein n=1 Tax=Plantactinospora solaniradicis TaxID=1723736 RepID=A0ABW1KCF8_9ACTN
MDVVGGTEQVFVSYHQLQVATGHENSDLPLYTVGDDLVQLTGESVLTVMTGPHTGWVGVRLVILARPPAADSDDGWEAVSDATLWCATGRISVCGLMGDCPDAFRDVAVTVTGPGLVRVRVRARNRRPEDTGPASDPPEEYEVLAWPVSEETGLHTRDTDDLSPVAWTPKPAAGAGWAMVRLLARANPDPRIANLRAAAAASAARAAGTGGAVREQGGVQVPRVDVHRACLLPADRAAALWQRPGDLLGAVPDGDELVVPAGSVQIRLRAVRTGTGTATETRPGSAETFTATWRWSTAPGSTSTPPDPDTSTVELRLRPQPGDGTAELTALHRGVRGEDAVLLGLVWDHLLHRAQRLADGAPVAPHPWQPLFDEIAARAAEEATAARHRRFLHESTRWGGRPPSDRLRDLPANTLGLARLDRDLLDALAEATPEQQRNVARWAMRRACAISGLDTVDWIAGALAAVERGTAPPPPFDDEVRTWQRLWADRRVPSTVVTIPDGTPNCSQQAIALPTIFAVTRDDPLVAAVDALHAAAYAHGNGYPRLFAAARAAFPVLDRPA